MSEVPDWMQETSAPSSYNHGDAEASSSLAVPSPAKSSRTVQSGGSFSHASDSGNHEDNAGGVSSMLMVEDDGESPPREPGCCGRWMRRMVNVVSVACLGFFGYALFLDVTENESSNQLLWTLYYSACAALTGLFLLARLCCRANGIGSYIHKFLVVTSVLTIGFGGVMLYFSIDDYQAVTEDKFDELMEVIGAAVGVWSVFFHLILWFCVRETPSSGGGGSRRGSTKKGKVDKSDLKV